MTVTVPYQYRKYDKLRSAGALDLRDTRCEKADCREASGGAPLVLTSTVVGRWAIFLELDSFGEAQTLREQISIALVRCNFCKARVRLLPCDVLPHKQYTVTVIEAALVVYCGSRDALFCLSLRVVVFGMLGDRTPSHTSLHGWTEGLGAFASGRPVGELPETIPVSWLLGMTEALRPQLKAARQVATKPEVPQARYQPSGKDDPEDEGKSLGRMERLQQLFLFLELAFMVVFVNPPASRLSQWSMFVLERVQQPCWQLCFRSALGCTGSEHLRARGSRDCRCRQRKDRHRCQNRGRSPPGDTN